MTNVYHLYYIVMEEETSSTDLEEITTDEQKTKGPEDRNTARRS